MLNRPPTDIGSFKAFTRYKELLESKGVKPVNKVSTDPTSLEHLLWMCNECLPNIRDDGRGWHPSKYSRWLGYIQGCLVCKKLTTVEIERNITRTWYAE